MTRQQQLEHLVEQARGRHVLEQHRHLADRRACGRVDRQPEFGAQAHRTQHAHGVLAVTCPRVADHAQRLLADVGHTVVVVDDVFGGRIVVQRIDGEVAPRRILGLRAIDVVAQHPSVFVGLGVDVLSGAKRGHLDGVAPVHHMHDLEAPADDARAAEQRTHLLGRRAGGDVVVLGRMTDQQIAHRPADDERGEAVFLQHRAHLAGRRQQLLAANAVLGHRNEGGFGLRGRSGAAENLAQQFADHRIISGSICIGAQS